MLGAVTPISGVIAHSIAVSVCLARVVAYPEGCELVVSVRRQVPVPGFETRPTPLNDLLSPPNGLRIELRTQGARFSASLFKLEDGVRRVRIIEYGATPTKADLGLWIAPIPEGDFIEVISEWSSEGVEPASLKIDSVALREAQERATRLWPRSPST